MPPPTYRESHPFGHSSNARFAFQQVPVLSYQQRCIAVSTVTLLVPMRPSKLTNPWHAMPDAACFLHAAACCSCPFMHAYHCQASCSPSVSIRMHSF